MKYVNLFEEHIKEKRAKRYNWRVYTNRGFTWLIAYPDNLGVETLDDLEHWESKDSPNRELIVVKSSIEAAELFKLYKKKQ